MAEGEPPKIVITDTKEVDDIEANEAAEKETLLEKPKNLNLPPPEHESTRSEPTEESDQQLSPSEKVKSILSETSEGEPEEWRVHGLFCQLDVLCRFDDGDYGWKESARWLKYEEKVEMGDRWSKPHVATTSLHALQELRKGLAENTVVLDLTAPHGCNYQVAEIVADAILKETNFTPDVGGKIVEVLLKPHKHQHRPGLKKGELAESAADAEKSGHTPRQRLPFKPHSPTHEHSKYKYPEGITSKTLTPYKPNKKLMKKIPKGTEAANLLVGQVDFLLHPVMVFVRLLESLKLGDMSEVAIPTRFIFLLLGPHGCTDIWEYEETGRAMALLFTDKVFCEVAYKAHSRQDLLDGVDEVIDDLTVLPPSIWDPATRLDPPEKTTSDDSIRARMRGQPHHIAIPQIDTEELHGHQETDLRRTGRPFGGMIDDIKRRYPQYISDIKDGLNIQCLASVIFLYFACITPIVTFGGLLGHSTNNEMAIMETLFAGALCGCIYHTFAGQPLTIVGMTGPLLIFESLLYQICHSNGLHFLSFRFWIGIWVVVALVVVVAFDLSALVRHITRFTEESFAVLIGLIFIYEAFSKLVKIYHDYPVHWHTVYEKEHPKCRCIPTISTAPNNSNPVTIVNGSSPNVTYTFNSTTFNNITNVSNVSNTPNWTALRLDDCVTTSGHVIVSSGCFNESQCQAYGYALFGDGCDLADNPAVADVFFLSCFLFLGTFVIAFGFRCFRTGRFFPAFVRHTTSDFAVLIAILVCTLADFIMGINTPKLEVPYQFKPTLQRSWVVNPADVTAWWLPFVAIFPAAFATILIFLDQQITGVIVNRKEHQLKKGHGYHLDIAVLTLTILICTILGLPWFVAATVRTIAHVRSLMVQSELRAPGEQVQFLGVREQRVTGFCVHVLIGISVHFTGLLRHIPMPVLYGVFLYMGVTSLYGIQFVKRILIMFMPRKYQPDLIYLRHLPSLRVHLFTAIQVACMVVLWVVKSIHAIAIVFPLMVLLLVYVRRWLNYVFSQKELQWLDHILPCKEMREEEDKDKGAQKKEKRGFRQRLKQLSESFRDTTSKHLDIPMKDLTLKEDEIPTDETKANIWNAWVSQRDYGVGKVPRPRKRSMAIIDRYEHTRRPHDTDDEDHPMDTTVDSSHSAYDDSRMAFRDRKFTL